MDDECEGCEECLTADLEAVSASWSWPWFFEMFVRLVAVGLRNVGGFLDHGVADQLVRMHNRKIDRDDQRQMAGDVLADLGHLPTQE